MVNSYNITKTVVLNKSFNLMTILIYTDATMLILSRFKNIYSFSMHPLLERCQSLKYFLLDYVSLMF